MAVDKTDYTSPTQNITGISLKQAATLSYLLVIKYSNLSKFILMHLPVTI